MQIGRETILGRCDGIEQHRKIVSEEAMEELVEEATRLVVGYLTG